MYANFCADTSIQSISDAFRGIVANVNSRRNCEGVDASALSMEVHLKVKGGLRTAKNISA